MLLVWILISVKKELNWFVRLLIVVDREVRVVLIIELEMFDGFF